MKKFFVGLLLAGTCFSGPLLAQQEEKTTPPVVDERLPGVVLAEGISQITGTAVSPLLGMTAVGAWKYFNTPAAERHLLPWYCNHWVWGTFGMIVGLCFLKDSLGAAVPALVKKPLDFAELFEDKASALVVSSAFVPLIASTMARLQTPSPAEAAMLNGDMGMATLPMLALFDSYWAKLALLLPLCLGVFIVVWLACHSINVIIAMSPFGLVDIGLKLFKASLLLMITAASLISPFLGLLVCVPLIVIGFFISGWTFRLTVFGAIFGLDVLLRRKAESEDIREKEIWAFNARVIGKAPVRSYGRIHREEDGSLVFRHRPWLVMPVQEVRLDLAPNGMERGVLFPSMLRWEDGKGRREFVLLPRYRYQVPQLAARYGVEKITDSILRKGIDSIRAWWRELTTFLVGSGKGVDAAATRN